MWDLQPRIDTPHTICISCGPVSVSSASLPCPACTGPIYDLVQPGDRAIAEYAIRAREQRRGDLSLYVAMLVGIAATFGLAVALDAPVVFNWLVIVGLGLALYPLVLLIQRRRRSAGERSLAAALPDRHAKGWLRIATGMPMLMAGLLVLVHVAVGNRLDGWWLVPAQLAEQPVRLLSHALVHASWLHLLLNIVGLVAVGIAVDLRIGRPLTALVLAAGAIGGGLAHALGTGAQWVPAVGASAMVYGMVGASLALMPRRRYRVFLAYVPFEAPGYLLWPVLVSLFTAADVVSRSHVAWIAHLGGLAVGVALGLFLRRIEPPAEHRDDETPF